MFKSSLFTHPQVKELSRNSRLTLIHFGVLVLGLLLGCSPVVEDETSEEDTDLQVEEQVVEEDSTNDELAEVNEVADDFETILRKQDGAAMVYVPAGEFTMGSNADPCRCG